MEALPVCIAGAYEGLAGYPAVYLLPQVARVSLSRDGRAAHVEFAAGVDLTDPAHALSFEQSADLLTWLPCLGVERLPGDPAPARLLVHLATPARATSYLRMHAAGHPEDWPLPFGGEA